MGGTVERSLATNVSAPLENAAPRTATGSKGDGDNGNRNPGPQLTEAYSSLLEQYIEERKTTLAEVAKAHPELFGKAEPTATTMIPYDV